MNANVTATVAASKATINAYDFDKNDIIKVSCLVDKTHVERDAIKYCDSKNLAFCEVLKIEKGKEIKYSLDSNIFMEKAQKVDKRPNGNYISRTANITCVNALIYNSYTHKVEQKLYYVDTKNTENIEQYVKKQIKNSDYRFLKIINYNTKSVLYIMPVEKFIELATVV